MLYAYAHFAHHQISSEFIPSHSSKILAQEVHWIGIFAIQVAQHGITRPRGAGLEPPSALQPIGAVGGVIDVLYLHENTTHTPWSSHVNLQSRIHAYTAQLLEALHI